MYKLHKYSAPGWTKSFDTLGALTREVKHNTCELCRDSYGTDLESMLASDCGCEYGVDGLTLDEPETEVEWLEKLEDNRL